MSQELLLQDLILDAAFEDLNPRSLLPFLGRFGTTEELQDFLDMANACGGGHADLGRQGTAAESGRQLCVRPGAKGSVQEHRVRALRRTHASPPQSRPIRGAGGELLVSPAWRTERGIQR